MTAFEWLKAKPQVRHPLLVSGGWKKDEGIPDEVLKELRRIYRRTVGKTPTDAELYWNAFYEKLVSEGNCAKARRPLMGTQWIERTYCLVQLHKFDSRIAMACYYILMYSCSDTVKGLRHIDPDLGILIRACGKIAEMPEFYRHGGNVKVDTKGITSYIGTRIIVSCRPNQGYISANVADKVLRHCMLKDIKAHAARGLYEWLRDSDVAVIDNVPQVFESMEELRKNHDARTARIVEKQLKEAGRTKYAYHEDFLKKCKEYGLYVPRTYADLVKRGTEHHNCVGTYGYIFSRTYDDHNDSFKRLFFFGNTTVEARFYTYKRMIVACVIEQCKGMRNADIDVPDNMLRFQKECWGMDAEWFRIAVINDEEIYNER